MSYVKKIIIVLAGKLNRFWNDLYVPDRRFVSLGRQQRFSFCRRHGIRSCLSLVLFTYIGNGSYFIYITRKLGICISFFIFLLRTICKAQLAINIEL